MATEPRVWVLLGSGVGGNGQMISLAVALGWPYETKRLVYNRFNRCPNLLLGASLIGLNRRESSPLVPPWPDLVIAASRRSAPVACWIKRQSGGHTRLVHLLHAQAPLDWFDLVITTPQYRLPARANVLHNTAPLNHIAPERLAEAASRWVERLDGLPRPYTALLVGGTSATYVLNPATAARLGREASAQARAAGGSLLVSTSPRTPPAAADALLGALDCPAYCYRWRPDDVDNPYLAYLALADDFIVTADSASLLVEACATGKGVAIFEWPRRGAGGSGLWRRLRRRMMSRGSKVHDWLVDRGAIKPRRDFDAYHRALRARGLATRLGESTGSILRRPLDDLECAVARVRQVVAER